MRWVRSTHRIQADRRSSSRSCAAAHVWAAFQPLTRRRLAAVVIILVQPGLQFLVHGHQFHEQCHDRFLTLSVGSSHFVGRR